MRLAGATEKLRKYLGLALLPQAGVAIGLVVLLEEDPAFRTAAGAQILRSSSPSCSRSSPRARS